MSKMNRFVSVVDWTSRRSQVAPSTLHWRWPTFAATRRCMYFTSFRSPSFAAAVQLLSRPPEHRNGGAQDSSSHRHACLPWGPPSTKVTSNELLRTHGVARRQRASSNWRQRLRPTSSLLGLTGRRGVERRMFSSALSPSAWPTFGSVPRSIVRPKAHANPGRVPEIEAPCADCLSVRAETSGADFWCKRHGEHHLRPHRYSYTSTELYSVDSKPYTTTPDAR